MSSARRAALLSVLLMLGAQAPSSLRDGVPQFARPAAGLELQRPTHPGAFFDVVGRRAGMFGYENREAEAWIYPLQILDALSFSFRLKGYPLDIDGRTIMSSIAVRPEATTFVYATPHSRCGKSSLPRLTNPRSSSCSTSEARCRSLSPHSSGRDCG